MSTYYAVHKGRKKGVYPTWEETKRQVTGFPGARFMKFADKEKAIRFVATGEKPVAKQRELSEFFQVGKQKGLAKYGIVVKKGPVEVKEEDPMFADKKVEKPSKDKPWADFPSKHKIVVFTDGSCIEEKKSGLRKAAYAAHFPQKCVSDFSGVLKKKPTNQRAELLAIYQALGVIKKASHYEKYRQDVLICTDSQYSIDCLTKWYKKWEKNNWLTASKKSVENQDIIRPTLELIKKMHVSFQHVRAHTGKGDRYSLANHVVDRMAFKAASDQLN
jgi:ribonuclease HI